MKVNSTNMREKWITCVIYSHLIFLDVCWFLLSKAFSQSVDHLYLSDDQILKRKGDRERKWWHTSALCCHYTEQRQKISAMKPVTHSMLSAIMAFSLLMLAYILCMLLIAKYSYIVFISHIAFTDFSERIYPSSSDQKLSNQPMYKKLLTLHTQHIFSFVKRILSFFLLHTSVSHSFNQSVLIAATHSF